MRYSLICNCGHKFESWFRDSNSYDLARKYNTLQCPECGSSSVSKTLMAPQVVGAKKKLGADDQSIALQGLNKDDAKTNTSNLEKSERAKYLESAKQYNNYIRQLRSEISEKAEWVGEKFAEEARARHKVEQKHKMEAVKNTKNNTKHNSISNEKPIWGKATIEEAKELWDEGIKTIPLGIDPKDAN